MYAVIDSRAPDVLLHALEREGFTLLTVPVNQSLNTPIASHADLQLYIGREKSICSNLLHDKYAEWKLDFLQDTISLELEPAMPYPYDVPLNLVSMDGRLFCNPRAVPREIRDRIGQKPIAVRQGYAKCAILPVDERALITEDMSIYKAAIKEGYDVLLIRKGFVALPGFPYGFIGGAASYAPRVALERIYFCGDATEHPDWPEIKAFCERYGKTPIPLTDLPLTDVGTVFLID